MRFHHLFALIGLTTMYVSTIGGSSSISNIYSVGIWISEISNPCILKRHILRSKGLENATSCIVYENLFAVIFIIARLGWGTWYLLNVWESDVNWMYVIVASSIHAVSLFWIFIIITKFLKKFSGSSDLIVRRILQMMKALRNNKALLLVIIVLISFGIPLLLTQVLHLNFLRLEVDGFHIM